MSTDTPKTADPVTPGATIEGLSPLLEQFKHCAMGYAQDHSNEHASRRLRESQEAVEAYARRLAALAAPAQAMQPLSEEQIREMGNSLPAEHRFHSRAFARAIEAAHRIGTPDPTSGASGRASRPFRCTACGKPYQPSVAVAPHAAAGPYPTQMTSSKCECGNSTFEGTIG